MFLGQALCDVFTPLFNGVFRSCRYSLVQIVLYGGLANLRLLFNAVYCWLVNRNSMLLSRPFSFIVGRWVEWRSYGLVCLVTGCRFYAISRLWRRCNAFRGRPACDKRVFAEVDQRKNIGLECKAIET